MTAPRVAVVGPTVSAASMWVMAHAHQLPASDYRPLPVSWRIVDALRGYSLDAVYLLPGWGDGGAQGRARVLQAVIPTLVTTGGLLLEVQR